MGARTLDAPRERLMTIMMARLCPAARVWLSSQYSRLPSSAERCAGGLLAVYARYRDGGVTGLMLKYTIMRGEATPFVMSCRSTMYHTLKA